MHIEHPHDLGQQEAIERLDHFLEGLMQRQPPGGITIKNPRKDWDGNTMNFSFTAAKGLFGTSINGLVRVEDDRVVMDTELPALVRGFVGEDRIRNAISQELGRLLDRDDRR
ncbi:MAG TPA: polyhydroxyalkanoic acid system family protein [Vicinamibacterales bacterium]|nr:polyhydroxyalkanoic acid system family protein [Vicinamibacterales bacterium]